MKGGNMWSKHNFRKLMAGHALLASSAFYVDTTRKMICKFFFPGSSECEIRNKINFLLLVMKL